MRFTGLLALLASTLIHAAAANPGIPDTVRAINAPAPLSQRVVAYAIEARYDPASHSLEGTETLTYLNATGVPLDRFPFHLYLNGFQPKATWVREARGSGSRDTDARKWEAKLYGADEIRAFEVVGQGDFTSKLEYLRPEDGNPDDRTVCQVRLPRPVAPGETVTFRIRFHDQFPETLARTGWKRDFVLGGQWFPKVGLFWHGAWNCHQFHANTEFFADFGVYDVKLTLPANQVVGASGVVEGARRNHDGTQTLTFHGEDIHDFAWTASPRFRVLMDEYRGAMGRIQLRLLMQPGHWAQARRHARILKQTLAQFEQRYGPYPYRTLTLVDPEPGSAAGGMEYPTFITAGTDWWMPEGLRLPEIVVEHEFGHQYWYGMVATNEFEEAWLDEGINSYSEVKVMDALFAPDQSVARLAGMSLGEAQIQRLAYLSVADLDPVVRKGWQFLSNNAYGGITYGKTACLLLTLEGIIGEDTLARAMHIYFMRYRFTHPTGADFLRTLNEVSGQDLTWYFSQAVTGTRILDYRVLSCASDPVDEGQASKKDKLYADTVVIQRKGDFVFPVDIEIRFEDGSRRREHWDGADRWVRYTYEKHARIDSVEVDPEHRILLLRNRFGASWTRAAHRAPVLKLANLWSFAQQCFAQALAWWLV